MTPHPMMDVHFTIWLEPEMTYPLLVNQLLVLPGWAAMAHNAEEVVETLCRDRIDALLWEHMFGSDEACVTVWVTITAPAWLVGTYEVTLHQAITATARKMRTNAATLTPVKEDS